jgi:hypothetical protein
MSAPRDPGHAAEIFIAELGLAMQKLGSQVVGLDIQRELRGAKLVLHRALFDVFRRDLLHAGKGFDFR